MSEIQNILSRRIWSGSLLALVHVWAIFIVLLVLINIFYRKIIVEIFDESIAFGYIVSLIGLIVITAVYNITNNITHASGISLPKSWFNSLYMQPFGVNIFLVSLNFILFAQLLPSSLTETRVLYNIPTAIQIIIFLNTIYDIAKSMESSYSIALIPKYLSIEMVHIYGKSVMKTCDLTILTSIRLVGFRLFIELIKYADNNFNHPEPCLTNYLTELHLSNSIIVETILMNSLLVLTFYLAIQLVHYFLYYPLDFSKLAIGEHTTSAVPTTTTTKHTSEEALLLQELHTFYTTMRLTPKDSIIFQQYRMDILQTASQSELVAYFQQLYTLQYQYFQKTIDAKELTTLHTIPYFYEQDYWKQLSHSLAWCDFSRVSKSHATRRQRFYAIHWLTFVDCWMKLMQSFTMQVQYVNEYLFDKPRVQPLLKVFQSPPAGGGNMVTKSGKAFSPTTTMPGTQASMVSTTATPMPLSVDQLSSLRRRFDPQTRSSTSSSTRSSSSSSLSIDPISPVPMKKYTAAGGAAPTTTTWYSTYLEPTIQAWKTYSLEVFLTECSNYLHRIPVRGELASVKNIIVNTAAPTDVTPALVSTRISEITIQFLRTLIQPMLCQLLTNSIDGMGWLLHFALREDTYGNTLKTVVIVFVTLIQFDLQLCRYCAIIEFADGTRIITHRRRFLRLRLLRSIHYMPQELLLLKRVLQETIVRILRDYEDMITMNATSFPEPVVQRLRYYQKKL